MTPAQRKHIPRRNYFVKKPFQARFILIFASLLFMQALILVGYFAFMSCGTLTTGYRGTEFTMENTCDFFLYSFVAAALAAAIVVGIVALVSFLLFSHRLAGPLFRFEKALGDMSRGDFDSRINLRRGDQLQAIQEAFNNTCEKIDIRAGEIKKDLNELENIIRTNPKDAEKAVMAIKKKMEFFRTS
jgi:methyl-accepting chemotaxis protein